MRFEFKTIVRELVSITQLTSGSQLIKKNNVVMVNTNQAKHWCFTLNNPTALEIENLTQAQTSGAFSYIVWGNETGENGTPHLQGYFILCTKLRLRQVKLLAGLGRAHLEISRGQPEQAILYCKKDGDFLEFGEIPTPNQGKRTDFEQLKEWIKSCDTSPTIRDVGEKYPSLLGRYPRAVQTFINLFGKRPTLVDGPPRPWQQRVIELVNLPPDDRRIIFCVDPDGKKGKSWLTRYWFSTRDDMQRLSIGKRDDLAYAIDVTKKLFVFDIPRGQLEYMQYSILEQLKDQMIFSPKYESISKILPHKAHVVVFCNEEPDRDKMTADRYQVILLPPNLM